MYGIYVCTSTDRFVGRMVDAHATIQKIKGHSFFGAFDSDKYIKVQAYCRAGRYANAIRIAVEQMKGNNIPQQRWTKTRTWKLFLLPHAGFSENVCANLAAIALGESKKDWENDCKVFCCDYDTRLEEDWADHARDPDNSWAVDKRNE